MKKILSTLVLFIIALNTSAADKNVTAMQKMVERLIPRYASSFVFVTQKNTASDCYSLKSEKGKIIISGNDANSMATGLNFYLKNYCRTTVTWFKADPIEMPQVLPHITGTVQSSAKVPYRFFLNYCTFGYSMPWWKWSDWEHFIDWMALNGINIPLAITGQEAIWYNVWKKLGLTDKEIRTYFTGPAHLPWHRMCNIDGWQSPLPMSWLDSQKELQKLIVARERELNMRPILPAFAGHIPAALKRVYPHLKCTQVSRWGGFADEYRCTFLDPSDSLYAVIQKNYLEEQTRIYGTDHIYGIDTFNEVQPPTWDANTLGTYAKRIYESLSAVDSQAIWLQMGWLFYNDYRHWTPERVRSYLRGVPQDRLILLDYFCDFKELWKSTENYYGQPYIWCYLGNFGGNSMLSGNVKSVSERLANTYEHGGSNFKGVGATLEGFDMNEFMYEFVFSKAWTSQQTDEEWIRLLADSHVGKVSAEAREAWQLLYDKIYVHPTFGSQSTLTNARPCLKGYGHWTNNDTIFYPQKELMAVWKSLLSVKGCSRSSYEFDVINVGRQALGNYFHTLRDEFTKAYGTGDVALLKSKGAKMKEVLADMEKLLDCHPTFSLKDWITEAREIGKDNAEKDYYEKNARTLITVWGDSADLTDYGNRSWAELTDQYYAVRWNHFIDKVIEAAQAKQAFDEKEFYQWSIAFERKWIEPSNVIRYHEGGDGVAVAKKLFAKYANEIR
jgi:alpha-N-acetylglucosaminidase